ncbi:thioredoxin domain-containing protein [Pirellulaceae bacterium]|nr:thioredoxin domain-containing protein [Pirellulaceae bacterium]MDB4793889.1 thioredoxin domain-containing protein [Pirellulaceae bacterium]
MKSNRLSKESSPYLLQHANNPVDWYPWGQEALDTARTQDKPIFLSIGYSACHWCHVMEHESFENTQIAEFLNANYISIKVDREERPDLDQIYMQAVMSLQRGQGGWPLSAFLTPECDLFFGGTYWPPTDSRGMPGFNRVLESVLDAFQNRRQQVNEQSKNVTQHLNTSFHRRSDTFDEGRLLEGDILEKAGKALEENFDFANGGFGQAPKFPHTMGLQVLMRLHHRHSAAADTQPPSDTRWMKMVELNLEKMALGGIYDHLAGGFARYSVDAKWLVPHFEKMLYDNGLLMDAFLDALLITGKPLFEKIIRETLSYQLNYMTDTGGGFHSTEDADSEGEEGKFYVWTPSDISLIIGEEASKSFCSIYDVTAEGNFEGKNILNLRQPLEEIAETATNPNGDWSVEEFLEQVQIWRSSLLQARDQRIRPGKDDKILVSWNSLMIPPMARAGAILMEPKFSSAAEMAALFILEKMVSPDGGLLRCCRHGQAKIAGYLDDYSYFINALITLFECDGKSQWLVHANRLAELAIGKFHDENNHAFFYSANDAESLIARTKEFQDSSVPSGNSMMAFCLVRLSNLTGNETYRSLALQTVDAANDLIDSSPQAAGQMLATLDSLGSSNRQVVICADESNRAKVVSLIQKRFSPNQIICHKTESIVQTGLVASQLLEGKEPIDHQPTVYVCENYACTSPLVGLDAIANFFGS